MWDRFGDVGNYVEPFFGSGAVLLERPHEPRAETVNDLDCFLSNFWRALQADPVKLAHHADWPVNEADLHARHKWLISRKAFREKMMTDPNYFDVKIAGWWVWGLSMWIGGEWCKQNWRRKPALRRGGKGVHACGLEAKTGGLVPYFVALAERLRRVRVCCGDWMRVLGYSPTTAIGLTGVFLDPPYSKEAGRDPGLYAHDSLDVAHAVCEWAIKNGTNPLMRIALCGYEGEHVMPADWQCVAWQTNGGYANAFNGNSRKRNNKGRERIWFSPHCLNPSQIELL